MKSKNLHEAAGQRTILAVLDEGDEVRESLQHLVVQQGIAAAPVTAIGAFAAAKLRYFDWEAKQYRPIPLQEQVEVISMNADIACDAKGHPKLHLHAVLGRHDGIAMSGDLESGQVRPTLEVIVTESPAHLRRLHDERTGPALIRLD